VDRIYTGINRLHYHIDRPIHEIRVVACAANNRVCTRRTIQYIGCIITGNKVVEPVTRTVDCRTANQR
jgi:hypothetical protein